MTVGNQVLREITRQSRNRIQFGETQTPNCQYNAKQKI